MGADIQGAEARHPLVSLIDHALRIVEEMVVVALHNAPSGIGEHGCLIIVAVGVERIHLEVGPQAAVDLILLCEERLEIHEHDNGTPGNLPAAYAHVESLCGSLTPPSGPQLLVFDEEGIFLILPEVRTDENDVVRHRILQSLGTR